jgi:hypothetical protein
VLLLQVMWSIGCTALLISSLVMTAMIAYMDHLDMASPELPNEEDLEAGQSLTAHTAAAAGGTAGRAAAGSADVLELAATAGSHSLGPAIAAALAADGSMQSMARQGSVQLQGGVADGVAGAAKTTAAGMADQRQQQQ